MDSNQGMDGRKEPNLPFGYKFVPTDLQVFIYLNAKIKGEKLPTDCVIDLDVYRYNPAQLLMNQSRYSMENQGHYFIEDLEKTSDRLVRNTPTGFWKVYEEDVPIYCCCGRTTIGFKTILLFHDIDGNKTDWKMVEYRCHPNLFSTRKRYIVCHVKLNKESSGEESSEEENGSNGSSVEENGTNGSSVEENGTNGSSVEDNGTNGSSEEDNGTNGSSEEDNGTNGSSEEENGTYGSSVEDNGTNGSSEEESGTDGSNHRPETST